ncbi:efflux RND transporter periplasmic adaptor subunit [Peribacillus frigoritolerans]|uniref:efflux RND transporter periplasmic adaptor subunit n=1 Tax=Peribacillus frigoritolerans TaxID=450367 RepID=UPI0007BF9588
MKKQTFISLVIMIMILTLVIINVVIILSTDHINRSKAILEYTITDKGTLREVLLTKGIVIPAAHYSIKYDKTLGSIKEISVKEGDTVLEGDTLIEYNTSHIKNEILSLDQQLEKLSRQFSKAEADISTLEQQLNENVDVEEKKDIAQNYKNVSSQIDEKKYRIQEIEMQIDEINQKIKHLQLDKENYKITSKMAGTVTKVRPFAQSENDLVVSIESSQPYLIEGKLSEKEMVKVQEGQKVIASALVLPNQKKEGTVKELKMAPIGNPSVEDKESYYPFVLEMNKAVQNWHHGYHMNVEIVLEERNGIIIIPDSTIQKEDDKSYVYVIKNGRLEKRIIQLGMKLNHRQEVAKGLELGERIVSKSSKDLDNKMEIFMPINHFYLKKETMKTFTKDQTIRLVLKGLFQ